MQKGNRIAHNYFSGEEYYHMPNFPDNAKIMAEDGVDHTNIFWSTDDNNFRADGWEFIAKPTPMTNQTAIQQGIERLKAKRAEAQKMLAERGNIKIFREIYGAEVACYDFAIAEFTALLPTEREQIEAAWNDGHKWPFSDYADDYFTSTYQTKI